MPIMIKLQSHRPYVKWIGLAGVASLFAIVGYTSLTGLEDGATPISERADALGAWVRQGVGIVADTSGVQTETPSTGEASNPQHAHQEPSSSTALDTGMEDWQKPENVALRAELQRWYDHREESSLAQRRADASALMAKVEARHAAGKINATSAALAKLMLLQGAPSDDPQHAQQLQQVMAQLAGQLSFGE